MNQESQAHVKLAEMAYQRGDFRAAKAEAVKALTNDQLPPEKAALAKGILHAIDADPLATVGFGITLFLLLFVGIKFLL